MKKSEKRLLFLLLSLGLLGAIVVCSDIYLEKRDFLKQQHLALESEWIEIQTLFEEKEMWELRGEWLEKNQPAFTNNQAIAQAIFETAEKPSVSGVTTSSISLIPVSETADRIEVGVSFLAEGELGRIFRWLYDITPPSSFRVVRSIKIIPGTEDPRTLTATIELLRWYTPRNS